MRQYLLVVLSFVGLLALISCSKVTHSKRHAEFQQWIHANDKIKVLSTTAMINDLVQKVGGDRVDTFTLIQGELDPHSYQLVKGDDEKLMFAHLVFYNGLGLEHGPSLHYHLVENPKAYALGDWVEKQDSSAIIYVNGQKDPHLWMDISLWLKTIPLIVERLSEQDPLHADLFRKNANEFQKEMLKVHEEVKEMLGQIPAEKRFMVTSHDAFNYFTRAYLAEGNERETGEWSKRFAAPEGLAPESQLSVTDIKMIINYLKKNHISVVFPESNVSRDSIRKIVQAGQEEGLHVEMACCPLYGDAMGKPGSDGDSYLKMIKYNAKILTRYMNENISFDK
ncbi:metal ABC transporter solute-binding protein, Zn/Mn family [Candidatus Protochlamydia sp. R18]|uniref:metal ABC transporter solute-binding protein, Zn/Mn family n=1 Tax=Candidatus Protochlamydia sp. R18 TaxID=1353977 RepID=UPI0005A7FF32|nr:zinc ABC transporter substrate-binding protein [Candidatus Protochlamydia sp. R18]